MPPDLQKHLKSILKVTLLGLTLAPEVDLASGNVVARWWQGGGKVGVKVAIGVC